MNVFLTGGTGFIGSEILKKLVAQGHSVTALVRSIESGKQVELAGATHVLANIEDADALTEIVAPFDAVIHTASPSDATSVAVDTSIATATTKAYADTNKVYIHTGGIWVYGNGNNITEDSPLNPPALTAWRRDVESIALNGHGMRTTIIEPGIVYGQSGGIPNVLINGPKSETGALEMIGGGSQHWTTVHVTDLADLYLLALADGEQGYYIGASGDNPTVQEMCEAISRAAGNGDVVAGTVEGATARLGPLAEAFLLDQQAAANKAKTQLGWSPKGPSIIDDLETGSYSPKA